MTRLGLLLMTLSLAACATPGSNEVKQALRANGRDYAANRQMLERLESLPLPASLDSVKAIAGHRQWIARTHWMGPPIFDSPLKYDSLIYCPVLLGGGDSAHVTVALQSGRAVGIRVTRYGKSNSFDLRDDFPAAN